MLFLLVPLFARPVLATPVLAFVPDAFPSLASSVAAPRPCVRLRVLGFGITGVCLHPRRAPGSGKAMATPRPRRLGLHRLRHRSPRRLPWRVAVLLRRPTRPRLYLRLPRHQHPTTISTMATPHTATLTKVAAPTALGYLDIGIRAITSHEHSLPSSTVQASTTQLRPRRSRSDYGGVSAHWFLRLRFLSSLTIHDATVVHVTTAMTAGECYRYNLVTYRIG
jgi:hypothetical protein